jgi:hypothetical protein
MIMAQTGFGVFRISEINERVQPTPVGESRPIHEEKSLEVAGREVPDLSSWIIKRPVKDNRVKLFVFKWKLAVSGNRSRANSAKMPVNNGYRLHGSKVDLGSTESPG